MGLGLISFTLCLKKQNFCQFSLKPVRKETLIVKVVRFFELNLSASANFHSLSSHY
jgi:hypothetical protein